MVCNQIRLSSCWRIARLKIMATLTNGSGRHKSAQDELAYEYLCRLQEAKTWIESVLGEALPPTTELEEALQNGVYLCRLGMVFLPEEEMWKKVYDPDQSKFKVKGLDYRYTDNINFWLKSLSKLGLPKVFYPVMTDIFHRKDMPKLVYCLHALSHLMRKKGVVKSAVDDQYGSAKFPHDALVQTSQSLKTIKYHEMPAFGVVENLVDEELQYQAMGLCDSYEEDIPHEAITSEEEAIKLFDDPTYVLGDNTRKQVASTEEMKLMELPCANRELKVTVYSQMPQVKDQLSAAEQALKDFNMQLNLGNAEETFAALKEVTKLVDCKSTFLFQSYADRYYSAFLKERKEGLPCDVLPVYSGLDRDLCDNLLESMSPGAYLVRTSNTIEGAYVFSFKNHTGIKHWKLSTKGGKFYWGTSSLHSTLDSFVQHFVGALSQVTKLHVYKGMTSALRPLVQTAEEQRMMDSLHQSNEELGYGQMCHAVREVNNEVRQERKSYHGDHLPEHLQDGSTWSTSMIVKVKKVEAERLLNSKGEKGSFLVRPSERTPGDYALAFRTKTDIRHWRITNKDDKYYVHPRPNPYNSLDDIISHFQEAVSQETGLTMVPLHHDSKEEVKQQERIECDGNSRVGTLRAPANSTTGNHVITAIPSQSMSRLNPANLTSWSVDDVCYWLVSQSLGNFMETFKENEVDGECLLTLDNKLLKDDLGITALGHRSRILKRVEALKNEYHPS